MDLQTNASRSRSAPAQGTRRLRDLPGPRGLPIVGNALQIEPARMHLQLEAWARQYGRFFRFRLGVRDILVVTDHAVIGTALRDRPERFGRPVQSGNILREMGFDQGLFSANGEVWRRQRRMVMAGFDPGHVQAYFPALLKVTHRLQGRWETAARAGAAIDLQADLMRFTVDAIAGLAFGSEVNTLESDDDVIQRHLNKIFPALFRRILSPVQYWRYVRLPSDRALDRSVREVKASIEDFIAQARERIRDNPELRQHPRNLLEAMINAADERGSNVDDRDVAGNVLVMLLAGEDTTANTLAWMIDLLHRHPQALLRAQVEVRRLAPDPARFTPEQIGSLDYLEACAYETMRLKPVAPILAAQAVRDTTVGDIEIPAQTLVFGLMRHDAVDAQHFPDPLAFMPERWLADAARAPSMSSAKRVSMPFGAGPRICPGRYLALMEIKMAMAMLLRRFEIASVGTPDGAETREHLSFSMGPAALRMQLRLPATG